MNTFFIVVSFVIASFCMFHLLHLQSVRRDLDSPEGFNSVSELDDLVLEYNQAQTRLKKSLIILGLCLAGAFIP